MGFEKDYNDILKHAKSKVKFFKLLLEPEDLINDAYVNKFGKEYEFEDFIKEINNLALIEKHNGTNHISIGQAASTSGNFSGDQTCRVCKEVKHISEFYINKRPGSKSYPRTECKKCHCSICYEVFKKSGRKRPYNNRYYNKVKNTSAYKEANKQNFATFVGKNRGEWNGYLKDRYNFGKENLTDAYIIKLLKNKHTAQEISQNSNIIIEYRDKVIQKRFDKLKKVSSVCIDR